MKVSVLAGGEFGTSIATTYAHKFDEVWWWIRNERLAEEINRTRRNKSNFPDVPIPKNVNISSDISKVAHNSDYILSAVRSEGIKDVLDKIKEPKIDFGVYVNLAKGLYENMPICHTFKEELPDKGYATISGPSLASELIRNFIPKIQKQISDEKRFPTVCTLTLAFDKGSIDNKIVGDLQFLPYIRLYEYGDNASVELCGSLKNSLSIIKGIGLQNRDNGIIDSTTFSGLHGRLVSEWHAIMKYFKANPEAIYSTPAGLADLDLTYRFGRNGKFGAAIAKYGVLDALRKSKGETLEGVGVAKSIYESTIDAQKDGRLHIPLHKALYGILKNVVSVDDAIFGLINTPPKT